MFFFVWFAKKVTSLLKTSAGCPRNISCSMCLSAWMLPCLVLVDLSWAVLSCCTLSHWVVFEEVLLTKLEVLPTLTVQGNSLLNVMGQEHLWLDCWLPSLPVDDDDVALNVLGCRADIRNKLWPVRVHGSLLLYSHRNHRLIRTGSPGRPPQLSHSSWTLNLPVSTSRLQVGLQLIIIIRWKRVPDQL